MKINVARNKSTEVIIFAHRGTIYTAVLNYEKNNFSVLSTRGYPALNWSNISRTQLNEIKKRLLK